MNQLYWALSYFTALLYPTLFNFHSQFLHINSEESSNAYTLGLLHKINNKMPTIYSVHSPVQKVCNKCELTEFAMYLIEEELNTDNAQGPTTCKWQNQVLNSGLSGLTDHSTFLFICSFWTFLQLLVSLVFLL